MTNSQNLRTISRVIASVVIISADQNILMGRKDPARGGVYPNAWHLPGGGVEPDEALEDAARREAHEETGINLADILLRPIPLIGHGESAKTLDTGEKVWVKMTFNRFEARLSQPAAAIAIQPGDDLVELRWFNPIELAATHQVPGGKEFFIQAGYLN